MVLIRIETWISYGGGRSFGVIDRIWGCFWFVPVDLLEMREQVAAQRWKKNVGCVKIVNTHKIPTVSRPQFIR
jgi:hypothetical protein